MTYTPPRHLGGKPGDPAVPGQWIVARTSTHDPYPCTCRYAPCRYERCPDRERHDPQNLPDECCGSTAARQRRDRTGQATPGAARRDTTQGWAERDRKPAPAARREQPRRPLAEDDLWGPPPDARLVRWDSIDEASPVPAALTTAPQGGSVPPGAQRQSGEQPEPRRLSGRERHCDCRTPWDADPPVLLIADAAKAGSRISWRQPLSRTPGADIREQAEQLLHAHGYALAKPWKDGRHGLIPTAGRKTRAGWVAPIREQAGGGVAVIDVPPEGSGVHCSDCCTNYSNAAAYQLHRPSWLRPCRPPGSIRTVRHGVPMLKRDAAGVWSIDPSCVWPPGKAPAALGRPSSW